MLMVWYVYSEVFYKLRMNMKYQVQVIRVKMGINNNECTYFYCQGRPWGNVNDWK